MIGHEAVRPDFCPGFQRRLAQKIKENSTAPVSTLGDMVGVAENNDPG
uniref:Uncharacterized protein n=1 Tax=Candidatus Kentrum sp. SD TaxID=2126332 RepID=A0A451BPZ7_9GAMM|nr:MAG: hypothetical protein BECKSD772D_GA0070982_11066 [Candidatus Kentron sp. SD]